MRPGGHFERIWYGSVLVISLSKSQVIPELKVDGGWMVSGSPWCLFVG